MLTISKQELQINEEIRDKEVLLIDVDGTKIGVISAREAQKMAYEKDLDLVKIAPQAKPPVCRILDYGKFCFEQAKKEKEARKNQKTVEIKEIRMFSAIDTHDFNTKVNQAMKFLKNGDKIKEACAEAGVVDKPAKMEGRSIVMFMSPKASAK